MLRSRNQIVFTGVDRSDGHHNSVNILRVTNRRSAIQSRGHLSCNMSDNYECSARAINAFTVLRPSKPIDLLTAGPN